MLQSYGCHVMGQWYMTYIRQFVIVCPQIVPQHKISIIQSVIDVQSPTQPATHFSHRCCGRNVHFDQPPNWWCIFQGRKSSIRMLHDEPSNILINAWWLAERFWIDIALVISSSLVGARIEYRSGKWEGYRWMLTSKWFCWECWWLFIPSPLSGSCFATHPLSKTT